jgi:dTMP kinase
MKGIFITFEGTEGCGKTTQAELLADYFRQMGHEVLLTREPGGPKISEAIRHILLSKDNFEMLPETELLLYMASRSQHTGEWIIPALNSGSIVISDRYYDSTIAYQGAARDIDGNMIDTIRKYATFGLIPDMTFLIDLPAATGLSRIKKENADRLEQESLEFHTKVRQGFLDLAEIEPRFRVINGNNNIEVIHKDILIAVKEIQEGKNET